MNDISNNEYDVNNSLAENDNNASGQPATSDDITSSSYDDGDGGNAASIGNENAQQDGTDDEFGDIDGDPETDNPLRRSTPGGGTADGTNQGNTRSGKGNSGGNIGNLSGQYDTNSNSPGGSGTMRKKD